MTGDAVADRKVAIIELDEAQGIGSVEIEDSFTLRHEISFHFGDARPDNGFFSSLLVYRCLASPCSKRMISPSPRIFGLFYSQGGIALIWSARQTRPRICPGRPSVFRAIWLAGDEGGETLGVGGPTGGFAIENSFRISLMIRVASSPYWKGAGEDRQNRLRAAFLRMSIATLATLFDDYSGQTFIIVGERPGPQRTRIVETRIVDPDQSLVNIDYVARKVGDRWFLVDVIVDKGISELMVRRSEYRKVLRDKGIDGLITTLEAKASQLLKE